MRWFLLFLSCILLSSLVSAEYCYQESANVSTVCGGKDGGFYSTPNPYGNLWIAIFYEKPDWATNNSLWMVKHGNFSAYNITIPQSCWDANDTFLILKMWSRHEFLPQTATSWVECWNGTGELIGYDPRWLFIGNASSISGSITDIYANMGFPYTVMDGDWDTYAVSEVTAPNRYWWTAGNLTGLIKHAFLYEEAMIWDIDCMEDWSLTLVPLVCENGSQVKVYTDLNDCGTYDDLPMDNGTSIECTIPKRSSGSSGAWPEPEKNVTDKILQVPAGIQEPDIILWLNTFWDWIKKLFGG